MNSHHSAMITYDDNIYIDFTVQLFIILPAYAYC